MELFWKIVFIAMLLVVAYPSSARATADVPDAAPTVAPTDALGAGVWSVDVYYVGPTDVVPDGNVVIISKGAQTEVWEDDGEPECDDPNRCSIGVVIYDPVDSEVLKVAIVALLLERPWVKETLEEMCPSSPPQCNVYYFNGGETNGGSDSPDFALFEGEGVAGDGWNEPVIYYPGDVWPLEAAVMLLLESSPGAVSEIGGLCPCSLDEAQAGSDRGGQFLLQPDPFPFPGAVR